MAGKKLPYGINNIVSWGATVVIIGLLFKIEHWRYDNYFIAIGLGTEAFLFAILGFQREHEDLDWVRAYPELDPEFKGEFPKKTAVIATTNYSDTAALDKMMADAKIGPELIRSLGDGLRTFGDKVNAISRVTDAGNATVVFTEKIKAATDSYDRLSTAFDKAAVNLGEMANTNVDTKLYHEQVAKLGKNLTALNSVYELELNDSSTHLKSMNKFYQNMGVTMQNFTASIEGSEQFKNEVSRLAKNLASLNAVYGNMLSAMSQPRS